MRIIDEATVAQVLTPRALRGLMRDTLAAAARGAAHGPLRTVLALEGAWFGTMPAFVRLDGLSGLGAKLVSVFPGNAARGLPTHRAVVLLCDPQNGAAVALVAAEGITERRTAAVSVVATERLAARPRGTLAILGAGVQGRAHLEAFIDAGPCAGLRVWSPTRARADALAREARDAGLAVIVTGSPDEAVRGADVIVTATAALEPLFAACDVADGAHVNAVGACIPDRRELPPELVAEANVYVDSLAGAAAEAGDLILAARDLGRERIAIRAELGTMLADPERRDPPARVTIFESLGLGIEDVACAAYVLAATS